MPICLESEQKYTLPHGNVCRIYREISDLLWSFPLYLVFLLQAVLSDWWVIRVLGVWGGLFGFIPVFILGGYICRIANRLAYHEIGVLYLQKRLLRFYFFLIVLVSLTPFFYWFKQRSDVLYFRYVIYVSLILAIYLLIQWGKIICCYDVLLKDILRAQLHKLNQFTYSGITYKFTAENVERAISALDEPLTDGLVRTSEKIYDALMLGKSYPEKLVDGTTKSFNLKYIDWEHPENNVFHVTEEFSCDSWDKQKNARPDIVLFVNGIPFAVIECKSPTVDVDQAVEQMIRNQGKDYIPQLFKFAQIVVVTNKNAVKYATCGTGKNFWCIWREQDTDWQNKLLDQYVVGREITEQDRNIVSLLDILLFAIIVMSGI